MDDIEETLVRKLIGVLDDTAIQYRLIALHAQRPYLRNLLDRIAHTHSRLAVDLAPRLADTELRVESGDRALNAWRHKLRQTPDGADLDAESLAQVQAAERRVERAYEKAVRTSDPGLEARLRRQLEEIREGRASLDHLRESMIERTDTTRETDGNGVQAVPWADGYRSDPTDMYAGDWRLPTGNRRTPRGRTR
ncbi:MAG: hypothetical protein WBW61_11085 [Rhodanobacteraceae bacterium]